MNNRTSYFKVGAFTLASVALALMFLILLGMGHVFQHTILAETYFDESVQGLNIGSPVKYRGVNVGKVTAIDMVSDVYGDKINNTSSEARRYIYVQFSLTQQLHHADTNAEHVDETIKTYVAKGLRASLATQDLVGNAFLSLNFVDNPKQSPALPISWKPEHIYIPSTPNTLTQITDNIGNIISNFNKIDFAKVINDIDKLTVSLEKSLQAAQIANLSEKINLALTETTETMQQINNLSTNLSSLSNTLKNNPSAIIFSQPTKPMDPSK